MRLHPADFRIWSLVVFTDLLAFNWLRILIWFDHMGLRVATLVNLTLIGGDRLDEAAAHFSGHAARTRVIPEVLRRFATWMPLLIPFYIPRGADWDKAWSGAEQLRHATMPRQVAELVVFYELAALWALALIVPPLLRASRRAPSTAGRRSRRSTRSPARRLPPMASRPISRRPIIYDGCGHDGRGGWSWDTGAAARMLMAAYEILGLRLERGRLRLPADLFVPRGELVVHSLAVNDKIFTKESALGTFDLGTFDLGTSDVGAVDPV